MGSGGLLKAGEGLSPQHSDCGATGTPGGRAGPGDCPPGLSLRAQPWRAVCLQPCQQAAWPGALAYVSLLPVSLLGRFSWLISSILLGTSCFQKHVTPRARSVLGKNCGFPATPWGCPGTGVWWFLSGFWELRDLPEASNHGCLFVLQALTFITSSRPPTPSSLNPPFFSLFLAWSEAFTLRDLILLLVCVTNSLPSPSAPSKEEGACLP